VARPSDVGATSAIGDIKPCLSISGAKGALSVRRCTSEATAPSPPGRCSDGDSNESKWEKENCECVTPFFFFFFFFFFFLFKK